MPTNRNLELAAKLLGPRKRPRRWHQRSITLGGRGQKHRTGRRH